MSIESKVIPGIARLATVEAETKEWLRTRTFYAAESMHRLTLATLENGHLKDYANGCFNREKFISEFAALRGITTQRALAVLSDMENLLGMLTVPPLNGNLSNEEYPTIGVALETADRLSHVLVEGKHIEEQEVNNRNFDVRLIKAGLSLVRKLKPDALDKHLYVAYSFIKQVLGNP